MMHLRSDAFRWPNATDDEERATDVRIGTCGQPRSSAFGPASGSAYLSISLDKLLVAPFTVNVVKQLKTNVFW